MKPAFRYISSDKSTKERSRRSVYARRDHKLPTPPTATMRCHGARNVRGIRCVLRATMMLLNRKSLTKMHREQTTLAPAISLMECLTRTVASYGYYGGDNEHETCLRSLPSDQDLGPQFSVNDAEERRGDRNRVCASTIARQPTRNVIMKFLALLVSPKLRSWYALLSHSWRQRDDSA